MAWSYQYYYLVLFAPPGEANQKHIEPSNTHEANTSVGDYAKRSNHAQCFSTAALVDEKRRSWLSTIISTGNRRYRLLLWSSGRAQTRTTKKTWSYFVASLAPVAPTTLGYYPDPPLCVASPLRASTPPPPFSPPFQMPHNRKINGFCISWCARAVGGKWSSRVVRPLLPWQATPRR